MVDSGPGRTECGEVGQRWPQAGRSPEAEHRDVRQPRPPFGLIDAELSEPRMDVSRKERRPPAIVVQDDHADVACLPVPARPERERLGHDGSGQAKLGGDPPDVPGRSVAEEREGGVQVLARDCAGAVSNLARLPGDDAVECLFGKSESAKEPQTFTAPDGT